MSRREQRIEFITCLNEMELGENSSNPENQLYVSVLINKTVYIVQIENVDSTFLYSHLEKHGSGKMSFIQI